MTPGGRAPAVGETGITSAAAPSVLGQISASGQEFSGDDPARDADDYVTSNSHALRSGVKNIKIQAWDNSNISRCPRPYTAKFLIRHCNRARSNHLRRAYYLNFMSVQAWRRNQQDYNDNGLGWYGFWEKEYEAVKRDYPNCREPKLGYLMDKPVRGKTLPLLPTYTTGMIYFDHRDNPHIYLGWDSNKWLFKPITAKGSDWVGWWHQETVQDIELKEKIRKAKCLNEPE